MSKVFPILLTNNLLTTGNLVLSGNSTGTTTFTINQSSVGSTYNTNIGNLVTANVSASIPLSAIIIGQNSCTTGTSPTTTTYIGNNVSSVSTSNTIVSIAQNSSNAVNSNTNAEIAQQTSTNGSTTTKIGSIINAGSTNIIIGSIYVVGSSVSGSTLTNIGLIDGSSTSFASSGTTTNIIGQLRQTQILSTTNNYLGYTSGISSRFATSGLLNNYLGYADEFVSGVTITNFIGNYNSRSSGTMITNIGTSTGTTSSNTINIGNNISGTNNLIIQSPIIQYKSGILNTFAYITNSTASTVSVVNVSSYAVVSTITGFNGPFTSLATPNGLFVYVSNFSNSTISVISTTTNTIVGTITTNRPRGLAILPNGTTVYACNWDNSTVSVINTNTNTVTTTVATGSATNCIAVSPDGTKAYAVTYGGTMFVINTSTNTIITSYSVGSTTYGVVVSPDNTRVYIASEAGSVRVVNATNNTSITTVTLVGGVSRSLDITPDGTKIYVGAGNNVGVITTSSNTLTTTISAVGTDVNGINVTPDGTTVYALCSTSNTVAVISIGTNTVQTIINVGSGAAGYSDFISTYSSIASTIRLYDNGVSSSNFVGLKAPDTGITPYTITLPTTITVRNNQVLASSTTGQASWLDAALHNGNTLGSALSIGTTDNQLLNLITNGTAKLTIATSGDITLSTTTVRTITTASAELDLQQTGDTSGTTRIRLLNRTNNNGMIIQNPSVNIADLGFQTSSGALHYLRFNHSSVLTGNTAGEFQFGDNALGTQYLRLGYGQTQIRSGVLNFNNRVTNKLIALFDQGSFSDTTQHNYYGFGISNSTLRYHVDTTAASHTWFAATSATASNTLFTIGGNGTISVPSTGFIDSQAEMRLGNEKTRTYTLTIPTSTVTNNCLQFASWVFTNGGVSLDVAITVSSSSFSLSKRYIIAVSFNITSGAWHRVYPISSSLGNPQNLELNIQVSNNTVNLRIIRTQGSTSGIAYIIIKQIGIVTETYSNTQSTYTDSSPTTLYHAANSGMNANIFTTQAINCTTITTNNNLINAGTGTIIGGICQSNQYNLFNGGPVNFFNNGNNLVTAIRASTSLSGTYTLYLPPTIGSAGQALVTDGSGNTSWTSLSTSTGAFFGNGSDGDVTLNSSLLITRDMYYNNLTLNNASIITGLIGTNVYRVFIKGTCTMNAGSGFGVFGTADGGNQNNGSVGSGADGGYNSNGLPTTNSLGGQGGNGQSNVYIAGTRTPPTDAEGGIPGASTIVGITTGRSLSGAKYRGGSGGGAHPTNDQFIHGGNGGSILLVCAKTITGPALATSSTGAGTIFNAYGTGGYNNSGGGGGGAVLILSTTNLAGLYSLNNLINVGGGGGGTGAQAGTAGNYFVINA